MKKLLTGITVLILAIGLFGAGVYAADWLKFTGESQLDNSDNKVGEIVGMLDDMADGNSDLEDEVEDLKDKIKDLKDEKTNNAALKEEMKHYKEELKKANSQVKDHEKDINDHYKDAKDIVNN